MTIVAEPVIDLEEIVNAGDELECSCESCERPAEWLVLAFSKCPHQGEPAEPLCDPHKREVEESERDGTGRWECRTCFATIYRFEYRPI